MSSNSVPREPRDYRAASGLSRWPADLAGLAADDPPDPARGAGLFEVGGHDTDERFITNVRKIAGRDRPPRPAGSVLITASTVLLAVLGAGCFYVSWWGQYLFIFAAKQQAVPAQIQAGMLDAGMVILSGLSLGLARQGKPSRAERVLIQLCAAGSAAMNYLAADDASPRSVIVFTAAPVFAAIITDRVVSVVRRHALGIGEESAWRGLGRAVAGLVRVTGLLALYWLRFVLAPRETACGVRRMVLDAAPLPGAVTVTAEPVTGRGTVPIALAPDREHQDEEPPAFGSKREAFEWHYRRHPQFGDRAAMSQVARLVGERVGLQWGTARTYASAILAADAISDAMDAARESDEEAQR
jgi:hypothetical protein